MGAGFHHAQRDAAYANVSNCEAKVNDGLDGQAVVSEAISFVESLRGAGLSVPVSASLSFLAAVATLGSAKLNNLYWAGSATLVTKPEDLELYNQVFKNFWLHRLPTGLPLTVQTTPLPVLSDDSESVPPASDEELRPINNPVVTLRYSAQEVLANKDFAACSAEELAEAHRLMTQIRFSAATRPARRFHPDLGGRGRLDLEHTLRKALRQGGETVSLVGQRSGVRPRRLVLLIDISGSMEPYARSLLRFVHAAVVGRTKVEAFTMATQLTRVTRQLSSRDPDEALALAAAEVEDWSGGTRLGEMLLHFNNQWGVRGMARGAIVTILSDGWDRGDPELLAEQMARLARVAHRIVWVNPLKASPGYEPLARGMAAALPFVDTFIEGHSLNALESLAKEIAA